MNHDKRNSLDEPATDHDNATHVNKKQRIEGTDSTNFLDFEYEFPFDPLTMNQQQESSTIPEEFFMFVTDEERALTNNNTAEPLIINDGVNTSSNMANSVSKTVSNKPIIPHPIQQQQMSKKSSDPPNQAVYTIIVGGKPFRLSWESLKSDGPSNFFLEYFRKKKTKVMLIDRDPDIFEIIVRHLRGYHVQCTDDIENHSLLYDATYYGLARLKKMLQEYLLVNVGGKVFRLPWDLFKKDGRNNFFTGPLMHSLFSDTSPPVYIDRDPDIFAEIINHLRGYTIHIKDEVHRKNLLRDAQYYVFRQLRDKLSTATHTVSGYGNDLDST